MSELFLIVTVSYAFILTGLVVVAVILSLGHERKTPPLRRATLPSRLYKGPTAAVSGIYLRSARKDEHEVVQVLVEPDGKPPWRIVIEESVAEVGGIISHIAEGGFFADAPVDRE